jgi:hypothetical protein
MQIRFIVVSLLLGTCSLVLPEVRIFGQAPSISTVTPTYGTTGSIITIKGNNFKGATNVFFGGVAAGSFKVDSIGTTITATVGSGKSGRIEVYTPKGADTTGGSFTYVTPPGLPSLTSFTPTSGQNGTSVRINGTNLNFPLLVTFGGIGAAIVGADSANGKYIDVSVGDGNTGYVYVKTTSGSDSIAGFSFTAPRIFSFTPTTGFYGSTIKITGEKFTGATKVRFGGIDAQSFKVDSSSGITAIMGYGQTGQVSVVTPSGTGSSKNSIAYNGPIIYSFTPRIGTNATAVTIYGANFKNTTAVYFGTDTAKSFKIDSTTNSSYTFITAILGTGSAGRLKVVTKVDTCVADSFFYRANPKPIIKSFTPTSGGSGTTIKIEGTDLFDLTSISIGGINATIQKGDSIKGTYVNAIVGNGSSGQLKVITKYGSDSLAGFSYTYPIIKSFSPTSGINGTVVKITGKNFTGVTSVNFGNSYSSIKSFTIDSDTLITATIGNSQGGIFTVINSFGTGTSTGAFTYLGPYIYDFSPTSGQTGTVIRIRGQGFIGVTSVKFGGTEAKSFKLDTANTILATVGNGATGNIFITAPLGTTSIDGFTFLNPAPTVTVKGDTIFCSGGSVLLTSSVNTNNQWYKNGVALAKSDTAKTYLATTSGAYSVAQIINGIASSLSIAVTVKVNAISVTGFTVNNSVQCFREHNFVFSNTTKIVNDSANKASYLWRFGDSATSTKFDPSYKFTAPGIYSIKMFVTTAGGCRDSAKTTVTVNPSPAIVKPLLLGFEKDTMLCFFDSIIVSSKNSYDKYLWSTGDTSVSVIIRSTTPLSLKVGTKAPVCYSDSSIGIIVRKNLTPKPSISRIGDNLISSQSSAYKWSLNNKLLANEVTSLLAIQSKGIYNVSTSADKVCWNTSKDFTVIADPTNVKHAFSIYIYPNPSNGIFTVQAKFEKTTSAVINVTLTSPLGVLSWSIKRIIISDKTIKLPVRLNLDKGVYTLKVEVNGEVNTQQIVIL